VGSSSLQYIPEIIMIIGLYGYQSTSGMIVIMIIGLYEYQSTIGMIKQ
jgi:hypothetical protein